MPIGQELAALGLAVGAALLVDIGARRHRLQPPGFRDPWRRGLALALLAFVLHLAVFLPLLFLSRPVDFDLAGRHAGDLFLLHGIFVAGLAVWTILGYAGVSNGRHAELAAPTWPAALGLDGARPGQEAALGLLLGLAAWLAVLALLAAAGLLLWWLGLDDWLPEAPPELIPWIAAQPAWLRLVLSASAGIVEETFFRGFLQRRIGIPLSTGLFVLAHLSYEQPLMLGGVSVLSLVFAFVVQWRGNVWAAAVAHATFNALQLFVVIPAALG